MLCPKCMTRSRVDKTFKYDSQNNGIKRHHNCPACNYHFYSWQSFDIPKKQTEKNNNG